MTLREQIRRAACEKPGTGGEVAARLYMNCNCVRTQLYLLWQMGRLSRRQIPGRRITTYEYGAP